MNSLTSSEREQIDLNYNLFFGRFLLNALPESKPRTIRLYVCAPFDDMYEECAHLFKHVFPKLREFSMSRYGIEFQAINLNWDVNTKINRIDDDDLLEIDKCQAQSIGMTFLALIGDVYGKPLLPLYFERDHFEIILKSLNEHAIDSSLLSKFYLLNRNYMSNRYELISNEKLITENESKLVELLRKGTEIGIKNNQLDSNCAELLNETALKRLMKHGAFANAAKKNKVFSFIRLNGDSNEAANSSSNKSHSNTIGHLRDKDINYYFPGEQIYRIKVSQVDEKYLKNFGLHYLHLFEQLIDKFVQENRENIHKLLYNDVLYHLNFIRLNKINELPITAQTVMKTLSDYVYDDNNRQPLILHGDVGSGKTSLISTFASNLFLQLAASENSLVVRKHAVVLRFVSIDDKSMYLRSLLKSICLQLNYIRCLSEELSEELVDDSQVPNKLSDLKRYFKRFLTQDNYLGQNKLVIILDSLHDLAANDFSCKLDWLPKFLSLNCKVILTVSNESTEFIQRLRRKYTNPHSYVQLTNLNQEQAEHMIRKMLIGKHYRLEPDQLNYILDIIKSKKILSLHLKIWSEHFLNWKSFSAANECILKETLNGALDFFICQIESRFGQVLVKHLLSYITISQSGFSECELQDLLTLDNEVLKEFKIKELIKPKSNSIKIPWIFLTRVLNALKNHIIVKPFHGIYTVCWRHQLFGQFIFKKYLQDDQTLEIHLNKNIAEYYLGTWSNSKEKPLQYDQLIYSKVDPKNPNKLIFDKPVVNRVNVALDRQVPAQPVQYEDFHTHIKPRYNLRKLKLLPYHLIKANMLNELFSNVFFNIDWIYAKILTFNLNELLYDFDLYKENLEVNLVCDSLKKSETALNENVRLLFSELTGRLLPFYHSYKNVFSLVNQCDQMAFKLNPLVPLGPTLNSPEWIQEEIVDLGIDINEPLQLEILESKLTGRMLMMKQANSTHAKFFDIDLLEVLNEVHIGKDVAYCNKNGQFVCYVEKNSKLIVKRIENSEFFGSVTFDPCEIGNIYLSSSLAVITVRKGPSPLIIDLNKCELIKTMPYQTSFCHLSSDEKVLLIHSENTLNYFKLPGFERAIFMECREIPMTAVLFNNNTKMFVLGKDTRLVTLYDLILDKKNYSSKDILQDRDIQDLKISYDESFLMVYSSYCIYVFDLSDEQMNLRYKLKSSDLDSYINIDSNFSHLNSSISASTCSVYSLNINESKERFTGFGCTASNNVVYATVYAYLVAYEAQCGTLKRVFQSTVAANRILQSYSTKASDSLISLLDNGKILVWNLKGTELKNVKFDDNRAYFDAITSCVASKHKDDAQSLAISVSQTCPEAKIHDLRELSKVHSTISCGVDDVLDNSLKSVVKHLCIDPSGIFCFVICDVEDFVGKHLPDEADFVKRVCSLIYLPDDYRPVEKFSYLVKKNSRFEIKPRFVNKTSNEIYLILRIVSCINDFDPYSVEVLDWTTFETQVKVYGPLNPNAMPLFDEFKLNGECLEENVCVNKQFYLASLMQECSKLLDKEQPNIVKAKRYSLNLNISEIFNKSAASAKVQTFNLNEFLNSNEYSSKNAFIDLRELNDGNFLIVYSKEGTTLNQSTSTNKYEYDYTRFRFVRNINTIKAGFLYDAASNQVVNKFPSLFTKETNVETLVISTGTYVLDNLWNLYDLKNGALLRKIKVDNFDLNYELVHFLFNGRYILTTSHTKNKIYLIRCYDSAVIGSLKLNDSISCMNIAHLDRTVLVGTESGSFHALKVLVDLESKEAIERYVEFYRNTKSIKEQLEKNKKRSDKENMEREEIEKPNENLSYDVKRVIHSAHAHRRLKSREQSRDSARILTSTSNLSNSNFKSFNNNSFLATHGGLNKSNLTTVTSGIKFISPTNTTRACIIQ